MILFQQDIRRALARMGRGFFPSVSRREETQMLADTARSILGLGSGRKREKTEVGGQEEGEEEE